MSAEVAFVTDEVSNVRTAVDDDDDSEEVREVLRVLGGSSSLVELYRFFDAVVVGPTTPLFVDDNGNAVDDRINNEGEVEVPRYCRCCCF